MPSDFHLWQRSRLHGSTDTRSSSLVTGSCPCIVLGVPLTALPCRSLQRHRYPQPIHIPLPLFFLCTFPPLFLFTLLVLFHLPYHLPRPLARPPLFLCIFIFLPRPLFCLPLRLSLHFRVCIARLPFIIPLSLPSLSSCSFRLCHYPRPCPHTRFCFRPRPPTFFHLHGDIHHDEPSRSSP